MPKKSAIAPDMFASEPEDVAPAVQEPAALKACPFCGGQPQRKEHRHSHTQVVMMYVIHCCNGHVTVNSFTSMEEAERVWNSRV